MLTREGEAFAFLRAPGVPVVARSGSIPEPRSTSKYGSNSVVPSGSPTRYRCSARSAVARGPQTVCVWCPRARSARRHRETRISPLTSTTARVRVDDGRHLDADHPPAARPCITGKYRYLPGSHRSQARGRHDEQARVRPMNGGYTEGEPTEDEPRRTLLHPQFTATADFAGRPAEGPSFSGKCQNGRALPEEKSMIRGRRIKASTLVRSAAIFSTMIVCGTRMATRSEPLASCSSELA